MKIVFVISSLGSGGAERVMVLLANNFVKKHKITILTFSCEDSFYDLNEGIIHKKLNLLKKSKNRLYSIKNGLYRVKILYKEFKKEQPDIIISFMTQTNILAIISAKLANRKIIISERISYNFNNLKFINTLRRLVYPFGDCLITQTLEDKKNYNFLKNVKVIYNPVYFFKKDLVKARENIILAVGRLNAQKGFDVLIKTFSRIKTDWRLLIVGEGPEKENLKNLISQLGSKNVILTGRKKDVVSFYDKASIFVLSSKMEGFPNVLLEAMSRGCACISFDCPNGPSEIIKNGENGLLVENQDQEKFYDELQRLITNKSLREGLSSKALEVKEDYDIEKIAHAWEKAIMEVRKR